MAASQYVDVPGYAALLLRRTFKALTLPEALLDRSRFWYGGKTKWQGDSNAWVFPSGAKIVFGYLEHDKDVEQYQSAAFQFIGFDELTQFTNYQYRYMFSRARRPKCPYHTSYDPKCPECEKIREIAAVPIRIRGASNPGSIGHEWVKQRFIIEGKEQGRPFIPATINDNPYLDRVTYIKTLANLDPLTRERLLNGDWSARQAGTKFRREWFEIVDAIPARLRKLRFWDMAATEPKKGSEPDWTAGCLMGISPDNIIYILDMKRLRGTPQANEALVKQTAMIDGRDIPVRMEQEGGSSGKIAIDQYQRRVLFGWDFQGKIAVGSKETRANPVSSQAEAGNVKLVRGPWINEFLDEIESFPGGVHDDMVDATSGAFASMYEPRDVSGTVIYDSMQLVPDI